jgi:hypothetical protein
MHQPDLIEIFITPLESRKFDYLITGSVAFTFYGEPRHREGGSDKHLSDIKKMINSEALRVDSEVFQQCN